MRAEVKGPPLRSREEADLATLIRWKTVVRIHPLATISKDAYSKTLDLI